MLKLEIVEVIFREGVQHAHKHTHKHLHSYFFRKKWHVRRVKEPDLMFLQASLKTYLEIHVINYQLN